MLKDVKTRNSSSVKLGLLWFLSWCFRGYMGCETLEKRVSRYGYGSIPINTIFMGMNIHLPAILGFTRYQGFDTLPYFPDPKTIVRLAAANRAPLSGRLGLMFSGKHPAGCLRVSESTSLRDVEGEICRTIFHGKTPWFNGFLEMFFPFNQPNGGWWWMHIQALVTKPPQPPYTCCPVVNFVRILQLHTATAILLGMAPTICPNLVPIACAPQLNMEYLQLYIYIFVYEGFLKIGVPPKNQSFHGFSMIFTDFPF